MIYIATNIHGRGVHYITGFKNRGDLLNYAQKVNAYSAAYLRNSASIGWICDSLAYSGLSNRDPGIASRFHNRVSRKQAIEHIRDGAQAIDCWNLTA